MCFLPLNNICDISIATKTLLEENNVMPDYHIISINSGETHDPLKCIEDARIFAKTNNKKGVWVLSGKQCSLAATITNCDITVLLNGIKAYDLISQMSHRGMTTAPGKNKKYGFVFDLNIHRQINQIMNQALYINPNKHPKDAFKYLLEERLITLNADHWMPSFGNDPSKINTLCDKIYEVYSSDYEYSINDLINRLSLKGQLSNEEQQILGSLIKNIKPTKMRNFITNENDDDKDEIQKGIKKTKIYVDKEEKEEKEEEKINYMDILRHIIPLVIILTIRYEETSFVEMFKYIVNNEYIYNILLNQTKSWWGKSIDEIKLKEVIKIYINYMQDDEETKQIIRTVKELFMKNRKNKRGLSKLLDKYIIPQEFEKKNNAEVSTPFKQRHIMLDRMPPNFWKALNKVFEPCAGKGGFIIDIIDRFMDGLKDLIPDEELRYKTIVEECLYFSDINPTNIFIFKLLIDPDDKYKLNYYEGNTLDLNIKDKWDIDEFDAIIGNPPYNSSGDTGTGNTIWQDFTKWSLKHLKKNGYLLYVHPPGWRKPNTERGKFNGLYKLTTQDNQMEYLSIHGIKDGQQTFKCGTRYDWYLIQNTPKYKNTYVNDEKGITISIDTSDFHWLPNYNINTIKNILAKDDEETSPIMYNRTNYGADRKHISDTKTDEFQYPCVHSTPKKGHRFMYSSVNNKGHFGVKKVIFGESGIYDPIIDIDGDYAMTHGAMAIEISNIEEGEQISKVLTSEKFQDIIKSCNFSSYRIDWNIFKDMKKNFWEYFN